MSIYKCTVNVWAAHTVSSALIIFFFLSLFKGAEQRDRRGVLCSEPSSTSMFQCHTVGLHT